MEINWIAVLGSAIGMQMLGAVWWTPLLFGKPWMRALGVTQNDLSMTGLPTGLAYLGAFVSNLLIAIGLAILLTTLNQTGIASGILISIMVWAAFALSVKTKASLFEGRALAIFLISESHELAVFALAGGILGAFN